MSYISVSNMSYNKSVWWLYTVISSPSKVDFLDITFNLNNGTYRPYKKPNDLLSDISKSSNHPSQLINQLLKTINERSSRNSSNEEIFNSSKHQCEKALRESGYTDFELKFNKTSTNQTKRHRQRNIIWFNPSFSRAVSTNVGKFFLQLYVTTSNTPTSFTMYLIRTETRWATVALKM